MQVSRSIRALVVGAALTAAAALVPFAGSAAAGTVGPVVSSVSPDLGTAGGGANVAIMGTGFTGATAVDFGTVSQPTFTVVSDTEIDLQSPATTADGVVDVTVTTPAGLSATGADDEFTYTGAPPTVTAVSPSTGSIAGGQIVTVTGTNFAAGATVTFGTLNATGVQVVSATSLTVRSPRTTAIGAVDIVVTDTNGVSATSPSDDFTYQAAALLLAVRGTNSVLYVSTNRGKFVSYGGQVKGSPAVLSTNNHNYYFAWGLDNDLYVRTDHTTFTHLRPGSPLACATPPGVATDGDGNFVVGCVGTNGVLYTMGGVLPATGNPRVDVLSHSATAHLDTNSTSVVGGVGTYGFGQLTLTAVGAPYAATSTRPAGNTYKFTVGIDGMNPSVGSPLSGTCSHAPEVEITGFPQGYSVVCHSSTSVETLDYQEKYVSSTNSFQQILVDLHGAAIGSASASANTVGNGVNIVVTGTNHLLYGASVADDGTVVSFTKIPIAGSSGAGPGFSYGVLPSSAGA